MLFINGRVLDAEAGVLRDGLGVLVATAGSPRSAAASRVPTDANVIDLGGRTLMPGLIDCHVHVVAESLDLGAT